MSFFPNSLKPPLPDFPDSVPHRPLASRIVQTGATEASSGAYEVVHRVGRRIDRCKPFR